MTFNKIDGATTLKKAGIPLPENWGKLSTSRAERWTRDALDMKEALNDPDGALTGLAAKAMPEAPKPKKKGLMGRAAAAMAGAVAGAATAVADAGTYLIGDAEDRRYAPVDVDGLDKAARKNATMKVFSDPKYRRTTNRMRRFLAANMAPKPVVNPEKPTRQMFRRFQIDQHKQPLEMSQEEWHKLKGFGKVQPFGSSIRQVRNKQAKAERAIQAAKAAAHIRNVATGAA